jgi:hypothetical protein
LYEKWLSGECVPHENSARLLDKTLPGTFDVFDLPLYKLLSDKPISEREIVNLLQRYLRQDEIKRRLLPWQFPDEADRIKDKTIVPVMHLVDLENLFRYNTIHSFSAILGIVRSADARGDTETHFAASKYLFRALPTVLKLPWFAQHRDLLVEQLETVVSRVWTTPVLFDVDWSVIDRQVLDPKFEPVRERRDRDPISLRFCDLEDPILEAEVIPGAEVKMRKDRAEARKMRRKAELTPKPPE